MFMHLFKWCCINPLNALCETSGWFRSDKALTSVPIVTWSSRVILPTSHSAYSMADDDWSITCELCPSWIPSIHRSLPSTHPKRSSSHHSSKLRTNTTHIGLLSAPSHPIPVSDNYRPPNETPPHLCRPSPRQPLAPSWLVYVWPRPPQMGSAPSMHPRQFNLVFDPSQFDLLSVRIFGL